MLCVMKRRAVWFMREVSTGIKKENEPGSECYIRSNITHTHIISVAYTRLATKMVFKNIIHDT